MTSTDLLAILAHHGAHLFLELKADSYKIFFRKNDGGPLGRIGIHDASNLEMPREIFDDFLGYGWIQEDKSLHRVYRLTDEGRKRGLEASDPFADEH